MRIWLFLGVKKNMASFIIIFKTVTLISIWMALPAAQGFTLIGTPDMQGWAGKTFEVYYNPTNCPVDVESAIGNAAKLWNSAPTSNIEVKLAGHTTTAASELRLMNFPEPVVVACSTNYEVDSANSAGGGGCTGSCLNFEGGRATAISISSAHLEKGYVVLNANAGVSGSIANYGTVQLDILVAHELGHVLGLGHSEVEAALMHYSISSKKHFNLHQDDIDGLTYLYPRDELGGDQLLGCGQVEASLPPPPSSFWLWFLPLVVLLGLRWRLGLGGGGLGGYGLRRLASRLGIS